MLTTGSSSRREEATEGQSMKRRRKVKDTSLEDKRRILAEIDPEVLIMFLFVYTVQLQFGAFAFSHGLLSLEVK